MRYSLRVRPIALDAARQFCDFRRHRKNRHIAAQFLSEDPPSLAFGIGAGAIDAVR